MQYTVSNKTNMSKYLPYYYLITLSGSLLYLNAYKNKPKQEDLFILFNIYTY